jgi:hypothetical protein
MCGLKTEKIMWQVKNKEVEKSLKYMKTELNSRTIIIRNPQNEADILHTSL